jgi:hypothetical protein
MSECGRVGGCPDADESVDVRMRTSRWMSGCGRVGGCPDADESVDGERCPKNMVVFVFLGFFLMCSFRTADKLVLCYRASFVPNTW